MSDVLNGLLLVFAWPTVLYMLIGIVSGMFLGLFPGLGGLFTLALMIPFIYGMPPAQAFAFLLGSHAVVATTGAITTILLNIPQSGPEAAVLLDGFPMTQQGQASRALGAGMASSAIGGIVGAIFLALFLPIGDKLVLAFGPPEFFMLAILGIVFIATVGHGSVSKALISGGVGLMLSLVGFDPITGAVRFSFGQLYLYDGIHLATAVIGLFGIAQVIRMMVDGGKIANAPSADLGSGMLQGVGDAFRHWWLVVRCSIIGTVIGFIPGLGGDVATFVGYGHAVQTSKNPEKFGKGAVEGVIAPLSAIHAKEGGALIPTLAFGIPGSGAMAILLAAFYIVGIHPGPEMLHSNKDLLFSMVWTIIVANIIASTLAALLADKMALITRLRVSILVPLVLVLAMLGSYGITSAFESLVLSIFMGFLGYEMDRQGYSRPALIIGLVLGKITEQNLNLSVRLYGWDFITRPITLVILLIIIFSLIYPWIKKKRQQSRALGV
ncbi:tripartite tricarboxylate transporter permease [Paradesulfitobacterium aromaticivorans]